MGLAPHRGKLSRPLLRREIETAQLHTVSNAGAARYLDVNFATYRRYARMYGLYETHKNQGRAGLNRQKMKGAFGLDSILAGEHPNYDHKKLKARVLAAGRLAEECNLCGFKGKRIIDNRCPLVLHMIDGDPHNLLLENLELRCYNCTYLTTGKVQSPEVQPGVTDGDLLDSGLTQDDIEAIQLAHMDSVED